MTLKTLGVLATGLSVLLAVLPAIASAENSPLLTYPTGTALATGNNIRAVNIGASKITLNSGTVIECPTINMTGPLTKNSGSAIEADMQVVAFSGTAAGAACTSNVGAPATLTTNPGTNGLPWCLRSNESMAEDEFMLRGDSCNHASRPIRFILDIPTLGECTYERSKGMSGLFKTHPEDAVFSFEAVEFTKIAGQFLCPTVMSLDMAFTLEKDQEGASPVYIS